MFTRITHHTHILLLIMLVCLLLVAGPVDVEGFAGFSAPQGPSEACEQHDLGSPGLQLYVYSDGRTWNFNAAESLSGATIKTKSVLASTSGTFSI